MTISEKVKILKNGKKIRISSPNVEDAPFLLAFLKEIYSESEYLALYPEEITLTEESERKIIRQKLESKRSLFIIAKDEDDEIIATAEFLPISEKIKIRHRATCAIAVKQRMCNQGVGSLMMKTLLMNIHGLGFTQLELSVVEGNIRAEQLYKRLGFIKTGTIPEAFHLKSGKTMNITNMILFLIDYA